MLFLYVKCLDITLVQLNWMRKSADNQIWTYWSHLNQHNTNIIYDVNCIDADEDDWINEVEGAGTKVLEEEKKSWKWKTDVFKGRIEIPILKLKANFSLWKQLSLAFSTTGINSTSKPTWKRSPSWIKSEHFHGDVGLWRQHINNFSVMENDRRVWRVRSRQDQNQVCCINSNHT